jgi:hypothetical protein
MTASKLRLWIARLIAEDASVREGQSGYVTTKLSPPADRRERTSKTKVNRAHRKGTKYVSARYWEFAVVFYSDRETVDYRHKNSDKRRKKRGPQKRVASGLAKTSITLSVNWDGGIHWPNYFLARKRWG